MHPCRIHVIVAAACAAFLPPIEAQAKSLDVLHDFACTTGGRLPYAGLSYHDGELFGTTPVGGNSSANGTVFAVNPATGAERIVYNFAGTPDGSEPFAGLLYHDGLFYGTTDAGGTAGAGTVFSLDPKTGAETVLYSFAGGSDASYPFAGLIFLGGLLYGTTGEGGTANKGTVFSVNPLTGAETVLHNFTGAPDGSVPSAGLLYHRGLLYGTTTFGGAAGAGTVFWINPVTTAETVLYSFKNVPDAGFPNGGLIYQDGQFYGTTSSGGGANDGGTIFRVNPVTGAEHVLHRFAGMPDGSQPMATLTPRDGLLYGTTSSGGASNAGTVFAIDPANGVEKTLHSFHPTGKGGALPLDPLIVENGTLYGTTSQGSHGCGSVFALTP